MTVRYRQNPTVEAAPLEEGLMILEPEGRKFCALNRTSSLIWSRLEDPASPEQLAEHVAERFQGVTASDALRDIEPILQEMNSLGIIVAIE